MNNSLDELFGELNIKTLSKLGNSPEEETRRRATEKIYNERRQEIQKQLAAAARSRSQTINRLNIAFYSILGIIIISIVIQFFIKGSNLVLYVQSACMAVLFPVSQKIDASANKQAYIEFTAAFLPDLNSKEAIKAIEQLYHSLKNPKSIQASVNDKG
ncbi:MAG TPA: hypothetical protein VMR70_09010 [Flavisolibacter sp.]|nr:hypothetical protein [Flavisolibacter sp.]